MIIQQLQNGIYIATQTSQFFGDLSIPDLSSWLQRSTTMDYLALVKLSKSIELLPRNYYLSLVKAFRGWVRSQIGK